MISLSKNTHDKGEFVMILVNDITIEALSGEATRRLYVSVPDEFEQTKEARYPVVYMFDGHNLFFEEDSAYGQTWGLKEFLEEYEVPVIIVAVECNHNGISRLNEYSPYQANCEYGQLKGLGGIYMDWLTKELKPYIDSEYPTIPERDATFICGSSMGGLMSLFAITHYSDVFSKAACLSPSVWLGRNKLRRMIKCADIQPDTSVYMDMGSEELKNNPVLLYCMLDVEKALKQHDIPVRFRIVEDGTHTEGSWKMQLPIIFDYFFSDTEEYFSNFPQ